jgi:hypothetical protein
MGLRDAKGAVAAYKRAAAEAEAPDLALLQGLADALLSDARPQEAVELLTAQQRALKPNLEGGVDPIDLQLLIGKVARAPSWCCSGMHGRHACMRGTRDC